MDVSRRRRREMVLRRHELLRIIEGPEVEEEEMRRRRRRPLAKVSVLVSARDYFLHFFFSEKMRNLLD